MSNKLDAPSEDNYSIDGNEVDITQYPLKLIFLGDSGVGKTSIIIKYSDKKFEESTQATITVAVKTKKLKTDAYTEVEMNIWDTAGQERYRSMTKNYLKNVNGIFLVFDLTNEKTFDSIDSWMKLVKDSININDVRLILVGNKYDLEDRKIDQEKIQKYAKDNNMKYMIVSAKEGMNIDLLFEMMGGDCVKLLKEKEQRIDNEDPLEKSQEIAENFKINLGNNISNLGNENKENDKINDNKSKKKGKCC